MTLAGSATSSKKKDSKMANNWREAKLYGIVDLGYAPADKLPEITRQLLAGGAGLIQLRAKGHPKEDILAWSRELLPLCRDTEVPFIVNDFVDIAVAVDADGVHLGQDDGPLAEAREEGGPDWEWPERFVVKHYHSPLNQPTTVMIDDVYRASSVIMLQRCRYIGSFDTRLTADILASLGESPGISRKWASAIRDVAHRLSPHV